MESPMANGSTITSPAIDTSDSQQPQALSADHTSNELNAKARTKQQLEGRLDVGSFEEDRSNNHQMHTPDSLQVDQIGSPISLNLDYYSSTPESKSGLYLQMIDCNNQSTFNTSQMETSCYINSPYSIQAWNPNQYLVDNQGLLCSGENNLSGFPVRSDAGSPDGWIT